MLLILNKKNTLCRLPRQGLTSFFIKRSKQEKIVAVETRPKILRLRLNQSKLALRAQTVD